VQSVASEGSRSSEMSASTDLSSLLALSASTDMSSLLALSASTDLSSLLAREVKGRLLFPFLNATRDECGPSSARCLRPGRLHGKSKTEGIWYRDQGALPLAYLHLDIKIKLNQ
jgi:hypothetical protein